MKPIKTKNVLKTLMPLRSRIRRVINPKHQMGASWPKTLVVQPNGSFSTFSRLRSFEGTVCGKVEVSE